jgi:hypothetical protein
MRTSLRYLRIAWSVGWGLAAALLIVLWVRSFYFGDVILWSVTKWNGLQFTSTQGGLTVQHCSLDGAGHHGGMVFPNWLWSTSAVGGFGGDTQTILGFNVRHVPYYVAFPYWAPVATCMALATTPFLVGKPFFHFSLRTLLIATTLVAVVLRAIVYAIR